MQRAVAYLGSFLTDFDIEDPCHGEHDLAGFGDVQGNHKDSCRDSELRDTASSDSDEDIFAPAVFSPRFGKLEGDQAGAASDDPNMVETQKRWSSVGRRWSSTALRWSTANLLEHGRDSPCATTHGEEEDMQQLPSCRSTGPPGETTPRKSWMGWLWRRQSPLKEYNVALLTEQEGGYAQGLMDRYLTEQTYMLEVAQAELIKMETELESDIPLTLDCLHGQWFAGARSDLEAETPACNEADEYLQGVCEGGEGDDELSRHGETSLSDGEGHRQRQSRLSEASTTKLNKCSAAVRKHGPALNLQERVCGDIDGLEELWLVSKEYTDSWACHCDAVKDKSKSGCATQ